MHNLCQRATWVEDTLNLREPTATTETFAVKKDNWYIEVFSKDAAELNQPARNMQLGTLASVSSQWSQ